MATHTDATPATVPAGAKQAGDTEARRERWTWVEPSVWTDPMLAALENGVRGGKWFSLIDKVYRQENLHSAFKKVKRNGGAGGVDHVTVDRFEHDLDRELTKLSADLKAGSYEPQAARRVYIEKPGTTEQRPLGYRRCATGCAKVPCATFWNPSLSGSSRKAVTDFDRSGARKMRYERWITR